MLGKLKRCLPGLYDYYLHLKRKQKLKKISAIKKVPDDKYPEILGKLYEERIGHKLDWNNVQTYTEKMQWAKLYDKNPMKSQLADKYEVRKWVEEKIGADYLIPLLGVWERFDDIDFSGLPDRFVLKTNHGSGTNYIVRNKSQIKYKQVKRMFEDWLDTDYAFNTGFEMHYTDIKPLIIAEQYIEADHGQLQDYKFLCFDGAPYYCWVDMDRYTNHTRNVYNLNWELQPWNQEHYGTYKEPIPCPEGFDKMIELAKVLCKGFSHVRVDFYNVNGKIYFGEMTFTNGSGLDRIIPESYDRMLGDLWSLDANSSN